MPHPENLLTPLQDLVALGKRGDIEIRPVLLRALTDMFISRGDHTPGEIRQFEAVALGLLEHTDAPTRSLVAAKLARFGATPPAVAARLIALGGGPAEEFLAHSTLVDRASLQRLATHGERRLAEMIAGRPDLDAELVAALLSRKEPEILRALVRNPAAPLDAQQAAALASQRPRDPEIARALCQRFDDPTLLAPLFLYASPRQREEIMLAARRSQLGETGGARHAAADASIVIEFERAAMLRDTPLMAALLARAFGATISEATAIVEDQHGEPIAVALAALCVPAETATRIFMRLDPVIAYSVERVRALSQLVVRLPVETARRLMVAMVGPPRERKRPVHAPVADLTAEDTPSRVSSAAEVYGEPPRRGLLLLRRRA